jgi:hypothetical protein
LVSTLITDFRSDIFYTQKLRKKSILREVPAMIKGKEANPG